MNRRRPKETEMSAAPTISTDELRFRLGGGLHEPGSPEYEDACTLFNSMIEHRPRLVARCAAPEDVVAALAFAREREMPVAVRAGGHSVTGLSLSRDGLTIDLRGIDAVEVDPQARIARVGGGATWGAVDRATQEHGLATTGGRVSTTGVAGLTLGGGSGWLERKHGLACDNLLAAELVTADGRLVRASAEENPDLLWALRGGGGNFGVVTALELRLHPVGPEVYAGLIFHELERAPEVLTRWRDLMRDAPEELSLAFAYMSVAADDEGLPAELRGKQVAAIAGVYNGPAAEAEEAMRPLRELEAAADTFGPVPYADFQCSIDDPPGYRNYWTAEQLPELSDEAIATIHARALEMPGSTPQIFCVAWGGAVARHGSEHSPLAGRDTRFVIHPLMLWDDPADDDRVIAWGRGFRDSLREFASGGSYLNFSSETDQRNVRAQYDADSYARLAAIKAEWDPDDAFHGSGHVPPRETGGAP
jgi:FAD/FMN-containing dehydrogenase